MKILVVGDYCPRNRVSKFINTRDFESVFGDVKQLLNVMDYSIVNLECPLVYDNTKPIIKKGPALKCNINGVDAIKWMGFSCVTLANNHFRDYGEEGVNATIDYLDKHSIDHVGGGRNITQASAVFYKDIKGKRIAIINCCEHEFNIATEEIAGSNPLNPLHQFYSIQEARNNADFILVIVHGGHEHFQLPSERMVETYRFFVDAGADAVINHHQHCYSGYEIYKEKPIFYGLGNFCFDRDGIRNSRWNEGIMVELDMSNNHVDFTIHPYYQCNDNPLIELLSKDSFDEHISQLNNIITHPEKLRQELKKYYSGNCSDYANIFEPIDNRYYYGAKRRGWLPSLISKDRIIAATNYICCESHRDKLEYWLLNKMEVR